MLRFVVMGLISLLSVSALRAEESAYPRPELLVEPAELAEADIAGRRFVVLDARSREAYEQAHVPGARWVDHDAWKAAFDGQDAEAWSERIGRLGIDAERRVVVYDDNRMKDAARIWWILRYWGVERAALLNGGWKTWEAEGLPTSVEEPQPVEGDAFRAEPRAVRLTTQRQILELLDDNRLQIVDARSEAEFCGTDPRQNARAGAIPGAKHLEWSDLVDEQTHRFKSPEQLRRLFAEAEIDLDRPMASHCQSGGRASVMAFGLELMGAEQVSNYYRGWSEWGNAPDTPIEPGEPKER